MEKIKEMITYLSSDIAPFTLPPYHHYYNHNSYYQLMLGDFIERYNDNITDEDCQKIINFILTLLKTREEAET